MATYDISEKCKSHKEHESCSKHGSRCPKTCIAVCAQPCPPVSLTKKDYIFYGLPEPYTFPTQLAQLGFFVPLFIPTLKIEQVKGFQIIQRESPTSTIVPIIQYVGRKPGLFLINIAGTIISKFNGDVVFREKVYKGSNGALPNIPIPSVRAYAELSQGENDTEAATGIVPLNPGDTIAIFFHLMVSEVIPENTITVDDLMFTLVQI